MQISPKESAVWYVAATHYLTAGFAIPLVVNLAYGFFGPQLLGPETLLYVLIGIALGVMGVWLGVKYSANYLKKRYVIQDARRVVFLSTTYMAVLYFLYQGAYFGSLLYLIAKGQREPIENLSLSIVLAIIGSIINTVVFYLTSRRAIIPNNQT